MDNIPPSQKARPLSFANAAIWALLALFLDLFFVGMTEAGREGAVFDLVSQTACQTLAYSIVFFGILRVHEPDASIRQVLALRAPSALAVVLALAIGVALALPSSFVDQVLDARWPLSVTEHEALDRILSVPTLGKRISLVLTVAIVGPAADELFFRGALFTPLSRTQRIASVVVATAVFEALGSRSLRAMITVFAATLVFAWIRGATRSVLPSMVARMAYSAMEVVPIALGREPPKPTKLLLLASGGVAVVSLFALSLLGRRDERMAVARVEDGEAG